MHGKIQYHSAVHDALFYPSMQPALQFEKWYFRVLVCSHSIWFYMLQGCIFDLCKWKAVYQSILCHSIVSSTLSWVNNLDFSMRICFFTISLASVELKSRLLTWHYLLKTLHGHQTLFLGRGWGLDTRLCCIDWGGLEWVGQQQMSFLDG